uniref:Uncharacterized protein n=1 Tax=Rousettus aegyptiacus TaxID=9407 RepID=A0A7J8CHW5_ROUAE|nr:hypothetical protein HJG63_009034 [Rousettus aegyptiacus]
MFICDLKTEWSPLTQQPRSWVHTQHPCTSRNGQSCSELHCSEKKPKRGPPGCPSLVDCINKVVCSHNGIHATERMNLRNMMLSETNQMQNSCFCMIMAELSNMKGFRMASPRFATLTCGLF